MAQIKGEFATETQPLNKGKQQVVIGIDSGSTTTKIVAVRVNAETPTGDIVFTNYRLNLGNPIKAVADGLNALKQEAALRGAELEIVGSCSTGYGEELIRRLSASTAALSKQWRTKEQLPHSCLT